MRCWWRVRSKLTASWIKGEIDSTDGGRNVNLSKENGRNSRVFEFTLRAVEVLFDRDCMYLTGYRHVMADNRSAHLTSVEVRLQKPQKEK